MHARSQLPRRPRLEVLEDRTVPASLAVPNALAVTNLEAQIVLSQGSVLSFAPSTVPAFVPGQSATLPLPNLPFPPDVDALGFPGRLLFPGTGVQVRIANGDGPLTQPPGLYLVGGSQFSSEDAATPRPSGQGARAEKADGLRPGEEEAGPEELEQDTFLPRLTKSTPEPGMRQGQRILSEALLSDAERDPDSGRC